MSSGEVDSNSCGQWNSWWGRNQGLCLQKQRPEGKCGHSEPGSLLLPGYMSKEESAAEQPVSSDVFPTFVLQASHPTQVKNQNQAVVITCSKVAKFLKGLLHIKGYSLNLNASLILQGCSSLRFGFASEEELNAMRAGHRNRIRDICCVCSSNCVAHVTEPTSKHWHTEEQEQQSSWTVLDAHLGGFQSAVSRGFVKDQFSMEEQGIEQSTLSLRLSPAEELCYVGTSAVPEHGGAQSKGNNAVRYNQVCSELVGFRSTAAVRITPMSRGDKIPLCASCYLESKKYLESRFELPLLDHDFESFMMIDGTVGIIINT
ncbi:hypothetical protein Q9966_006006 [Columba livia]|nr:hypothetical protein Q9966_006006 [Columba livia]